MSQRKPQYGSLVTASYEKDVKSPPEEANLNLERCNSLVIPAKAHLFLLQILRKDLLASDDMAKHYSSTCNSIYRGATKTGQGAMECYAVATNTGRDVTIYRYVVIVQ